MFPPHWYILMRSVRILVLITWGHPFLDLWRRHTCDSEFADGSMSLAPGHLTHHARDALVRLGSSPCVVQRSYHPVPVDTPVTRHTPPYNTRLSSSHYINLLDSCDICRSMRYTVCIHSVCAYLYVAGICMQRNFVYTWLTGLNKTVRCNVSYFILNYTKYVLSTAT